MLYRLTTVKRSKSSSCKITLSISASRHNNPPAARTRLRALALVDELRALAMSFSIQEDVGNPDGVYDPLGEFADGDEKEGVSMVATATRLPRQECASLFLLW